MKIKYLIYILFPIINIATLFAQVNINQKDSIIRAFHNESDLHKKEIILKRWEEVLIPSPDNGFDFPRSIVLFSYLKEKNLDKAYEYALTLDTLFFRCSYLHNVGNEFLVFSDTIRGKFLLERALSSGEIFRDADPRVSNNKIMHGRESYIYILKDYYNLLYKLKDWKYAIIAGDMVYNYSPQKDLKFYHQYAELLLKNKLYAKSLPIITQYMRMGGEDNKIISNLQKAYLADNRPKSEYKNFHSILIKEQQDYLKKDHTYMDAIDFKLRSMDGKFISLSDYKGKIIILDFWATWCGPCIASFPALQIASSHFKQDNDVVFLFIDTFERTANYESEVRKLMQSKSYDFMVLYDEKSIETGLYPVVDSYNIKNIPTKLIIDKNSKVRYFMVGNSGDTDSMAEDLISKIESLKK